MNDLNEQLQRYAEAERMLWRGDEEMQKQALATLTELRDAKVLLVAFDRVADPAGKRYNVSTINRQSSASLAYGDWYAETMVFECQEDGSHGDLICQDEASVGSRVQHDRIVEMVVAGRIAVLEGVEDDDE